MNYYLVAPGTSIKSTYNNGGYATMSGTSMAAPVVTGAAALLKSYWPKLTARQIGEIFLTTATDLGAKGVDVIYGRGLLNLEAALKPAGALKLAAAMAAPVRHAGLEAEVLTPTLGSPVHAARPG
jgi:subtilisin family serine protease